MYFSHTDRMEKKVEEPVKAPAQALPKKEVQMISVHGNKIFAGSICVCLVTLFILFGEILLERKSRLRLYEKQYTEALSSLEKSNQELICKHENLSAR